MTRTLVVIGSLSIALFLCFLPLSGLAVDLPHTNNCGDCHTLHAAPGGDLTAFASNANLCLSCHNDTGIAAGKPFNDTMQAIPGTSGSSHRWDVLIDCAVPGTCGPNSRYGLRQPAADPDNPVFPTEIQNTTLNIMLKKYDNVVTCSTCHNQHLQSSASFDPFEEDSGTTSTGAGDNLTVIDNTKTWTEDEWQGFAVEITSGPIAGEIRRIASNTATGTLTVEEAFSQAVGSGVTYQIFGGNFQRLDNDMAQLCEDCHYYRTLQAGQTNVRVFDGKKKSHPIGIVFPTGISNDPTRFNTEPREPAGANWAPQTGAPRYHLNGGTDTNATNNVVFDSTQKIRCLTCHGMHYVDSDENTVDQP
jgi:predicted CXXCH cytochrome family protein